MSFVVVGAMIAAGHLPLLVEFFVDLGSREQYGFYPLLLIAAGVLAYVRLEGVPAGEVRRGSWSVAGSFLTVSLALSAFGATFYMRWFAAPAAWLTLAGIVWRTGGPAVARAMLPVGVLLVVIVPPPFHVDDVLTRALQRLAVQKSSGLLDLLRVPHVTSGTVLEIPGHRLMVEEACSGINSLLSVIAFTLLFSFLKRRSVLATACLLLLAVWFVLCANVERITLGAFAQALFGIDLMQESVHALTGLLLFGVSLGLVVSADQLLQAIGGRLRGFTGGSAPFPDGGELPEAAEIFPGPAPVLGAMPGWGWWVIAAAFVCSGILSRARLKDCWPVSHMPGTVTLNLPAQVGPWTRADDAISSERTENYAKYLKRWHYRRSDGLVAEVGLAYPFTTGYHDPAVCYLAAGWSLTGRAAHDGRTNGVQAEENQESKAYFELNLAKPGEWRGQVLFAAFDERGNWQSPPVEAAPLDSLSYRIWLSRKVASLSPTHDVQALIVSRGPLAPADSGDLKTLFLSVREAIAEQSLRQLPDGAASTRAKR